MYLINKSSASTVLPYGKTGNWQLVFNDEFNGTSLDLNKWQPNWLGPSATAITKPVNSDEVSCYDPNQVSVSGGNLVLTAVRRSCNGYNFASGLVNSNKKFNFTYGYMEARVWLPAGEGMWPAFWANGQNWPEDGEIDVLEAYGDDECTYHYHYAGCGEECNPGGETIIKGATSGWHIYAAHWEPGSITWYYDGRKVWQYTSNIVSTKMYLIANLGLDSQNSAVPAVTKFDYIRVWDFIEPEELPTPEPDIPDTPSTPVTTPTTPSTPAKPQTTTTNTSGTGTDSPASVTPNPDTANNNDDGSDIDTATNNSTSATDNTIQEKNTSTLANVSKISSLFWITSGVFITSTLSIIGIFFIKMRLSS